MKLRTTWGVFEKAAVAWTDDNAMRLGASLAFYTLLSSAPLLVIVLGIAGVVFGQDAVQGQLVEQLRELMGDEGAKAVQTMIANAGQPGAGGVAMTIGVLMLLFGASGVFAELQDASTRSGASSRSPAGRCGSSSANASCRSSWSS
jgi:membrane protein